MKLNSAVSLVCFFSMLHIGVSADVTLPTFQPFDSAINGTSNPELSDRREFVVTMAREAWNAYKQYAWGDEFLRPLSYKQSDKNVTNSGKTILSSLSTLWLLNLKNEFSQAKHWVQYEMNATRPNLQVFWSLVSAFFLSNDKLFFNKAIEVLQAKDLQIRLPDYVFNELESYLLEHMLGRQGQLHRRLFDQGKSHTPGFYPSKAITQSFWRDSKLISIFTMLNSTYCNFLNQFFEIMEYGQYPAVPGIHNSSNFVYFTTTGNQTMDQVDCVYGALSGLAYLASKNHCHAFIGENRRQSLEEEQCQEAKQSIEIIFKTAQEYMLTLSKNFTETCHRAANSTNAFMLPPEQVQFDLSNSTVNGSISLGADESFRLSPYHAQAYFVLYRVTKEQKYRDYAWELAQAIQKYCRTSTGGYVGIEKLSDSNSAKIDKQPSEFLGETLKYLYLIFAPDDFVSLDKWSFNNFGQPLPVCGQNPAFPKCT